MQFVLAEKLDDELLGKFYTRRKSPIENQYVAKAAFHNAINRVEKSTRAVNFGDIGNRGQRTFFARVYPVWPAACSLYRNDWRKKSVS
jgi:hypothetical protein